MKTWRLALALGIATLLFVRAGAQNLDADLQRAIQRETVSGDLKAAIADYQKIADRAGANKTLAAQALLHLAESHQKLGDAEARVIYERIVRDFGDQKDVAALATARILQATTAAPVRGGLALSNRVAWTVPEEAYFWGGVSADGRYLAFGNTSDLNLYLHDFTTGADRRLTDGGKPTDSWDDAEGYGDDTFAFSKDGKQLAYSWRIKTREELRVVSLQGRGIQRPRVLVSEPDLKFISAFDWSPNGKWLAVGKIRHGRNDSQLTLFSMEDGTTRLLKSVDVGPGGDFGVTSFSPDSKYVAFNPHQRGSDSARDIFIIALDSGAEMPVVVHRANDALQGWSPDGKELIFSSDRTGGTGLWALPFDQGRLGTPRPIDGAPPCAGCRGTSRDDHETGGFGDPLGLTSSGSFYYLLRPGDVKAVKVATINFASGGIEAAPADIEFVGSNEQPVLSNDASHLAFLSSRSRTGLALVIRAMDTGDTRELRPNLTVMRNLAWSPDGTSFACDGQLNGASGVYRIDAGTGATTLIAQSASFRQWSADSKKMSYDRPGQTQGVQSVVERDLASGAEREIHLGRPSGANRLALSSDSRTVYYRTYSQTGPPDLNAKDIISGKETVLVRQRRIGGVFLSPDGRFVLTPLPDAPTNASALLLVPTDGSGARELPGDFSFVTWSPDSLSIIANRRAPSSAAPTFWWIPIDGRQPRQLNLEDNGRILSRAVAKGKWLAFEDRVAASGPDQVWVLEHFLPVVSSKK